MGTGKGNKMEEKQYTDFMDVFDKVHAQRDSINVAIITAYEAASNDTQDKNVLEKFEQRIECAKKKDVF